LHAKLMAGCFNASVADGFDMDACGASCLACQPLPLLHDKG
jgi:hypothetical protein